MQPLLEHGADIDAQDLDASIPFHLAISQGSTDKFQSGTEHI
jgi:ankyrin repeat protein